jgi:hypothetical protein
MRLLDRLGMYPKVQETRELPIPVEHPLDLDADAADWRGVWCEIMERCAPAEAHELIQQEREDLWKLVHQGQLSEAARERCMDEFWYLTNLEIQARY